jgi:hypothetical protein
MILLRDGSLDKSPQESVLFQMDIDLGALFD